MTLRNCTCYLRRRSTTTKDFKRRHRTTFTSRRASSGQPATLDSTFFYFNPKRRYSYNIADLYVDITSHAYWIQITALFHKIFWDLGVLNHTAYCAGYVVGTYAIYDFDTKGTGKSTLSYGQELLLRTFLAGLFLRSILTKINLTEYREAESVFHSHFPMGSNLGRLTLRVRFDASGLLGISAMGLSTNQLVSG